MSFSFKKILNWIDQHGLLLLSSFLLVFIPLYPKIPTFSPIEQYIVRVRLEDFFVAFAVLAWVVQFIRKKVHWKSSITWFIGTYTLVSLLSLISAVLIIQTIPINLMHIEKSTLHWLRYIEYFSLFFIVLGSIRSKYDIKIILGVIVSTLVGVIIYGYGQKYFYWPVYSTMNREFSKGVRLYLTEHARVQSTFAGHYDLAAYLVIILPLILALTYQAKQRWLKIFLLLTHFTGVWLLVVSAARTSFVGYGVGMALVVIFYALQKKKWWGKIQWGTSRLLFNLVIIGFLVIRFGSDISDRFTQVIDSYPALKTAYDQEQTFVKDLPKKLGLEHATPAKPTPPPNAISTDEAAAKIIVASDQRPTPYRPSDVFADIPDKVAIATKSADGTITTIIVEQPRTWSENSLKYGLSMAIRLDTLWPDALRGFMRDPLFGSGYATLNKISLDDFTIAESTDNNLLRTLGETGLLGFVSFYGTVIAGIVIAWKQLRAEDRLLRAVAIGYIAAAVGLLINAVYIDVFASSKVAFTFWSLTGLLVGYVLVARKAHHAKKNSR